MRNPQLSHAFVNWFGTLTRTAKKARQVGLKRVQRQLKPGIVTSDASTVEELRRDLQDLSPGTSLRLPLNDVSPDLKQQLWNVSSRLGKEFSCSAEFRPDGELWFVKQG